ncbi:NADH oxidase [Streptomyces sp. NPDC086554]|uniref:NADH oxidase n=1 Tax=unclassified Streptomyces TaxID=2593676 RepID=UPI00342164F1
MAQSPESAEPFAGQLIQLWSLREDVEVAAGDGAEHLSLKWNSGTEWIGDPTPLVRNVLSRMELGPVVLDNAWPAPTGPEDPDPYEVLLPVFERLSHLIVRTLGVDDLRGPLLSVVPVAEGAQLVLAGRRDGRALRTAVGLSMAFGESSVRLQTASSPHHVLIHRPEPIWVVGLLGWPVTPAVVSDALPLPAEVTDAILDYLAVAGMVVPDGDPTD